MAAPTPRPPATNGQKLVLLLGIIAGLAVGFGIGLVSGRAENTTTVAASTATTVLVTTSASQAPTTTRPTTTTEPPTTTTTAPPYTPVPTDFKIEVVELERSCFGSAGCNVRFQIKPTYVGAQVPPATGSYTILYAIQGADSPKTGSFTLQGDKVRYDKEDSASTPGSGPLIAVPTRVLEQ